MQEMSNPSADPLAKNASMILSRQTMLASPTGRWVMAGMMTTRLRGRTAATAATPTRHARSGREAGRRRGDGPAQERHAQRCGQENTRDLVHLNSPFAIIAEQTRFSCNS